MVLKTSYQNQWSLKIANLLACKTKWIPEYKNDASPVFGQIELNMEIVAYKYGPILSIKDKP